MQLAKCTQNAQITRLINHCCCRDKWKKWNKIYAPPKIGLIFNYTDDCDANSNELVSWLLYGNSLLDQYCISSFQFTSREKAKTKNEKWNRKKKIKSKTKYACHHFGLIAWQILNLDICCACAAYNLMLLLSLLCLLLCVIAPIRFSCCKKPI